MDSQSTYGSPSAWSDAGITTIPGLTPRPFLSRTRRFLLVLLILLLPVQFLTGTDIRFAPSDVVLVLLVGISALWMSTKRDDWTVWHFALLAVFSASLLDSAFRYGSVTKWAVLNKYLGFLALLLLYLLIVQYARSLDAIWRVARLLLAAVALQAAVALPLYVIGVLWYPPLRVDRIAALLVDPNAFAGLLVLALALHWATVYSPRPLVPRRLAWPVTLVLMASLLFTFSRSGWIAFAFIVGALFVLRPVAWRHIVLPVVGGAAFVALFMQGYFLNSILPLMLRPDQAAGRVTIIKNAVSAFLEHPIFGGGLGSYLQEQSVQVHNSFFWMLADMGIIGALALAGLVTALAMRGYRAYRAADNDYQGLVLGLFISHLAMVGLSLGIEAMYQRSWWVVMALLNACWVLTVKTRRTPC
jgi:O-antigen ligase